MRRSLPPLTALRAFEAAARQLSFTRAAEELNVTQAAISHQVKALEDWLGLPLFRRTGRSLLLTDSGAAYLNVVREAFDRLDEGTTRLLARDRAGNLTVSVLASFAAKWLVPRLGRFRDLHPEIDVRIQAFDALVDFAREDVDVAIRYGRGNWPGLAAVRFLTEDIMPVCSPRLVEGPRPLAEPADLRHHTLLHDYMREDWRMWLMAAGVQGIDPTRGPSFSHSSMVLQAAIDGLGVALGRSALITDDLKAGRLVKPFELALHTDYAYYLVYPEGSGTRPKIVAFRNWLEAEAAADGAG
ncbi:MAG: transcriptional regulator GcvA [Thalassobaculales bacterium]